MRADASSNPIVHALQDCDDPDCELHNPEVGFNEGTVDKWQFAFYLVGIQRGLNPKEVKPNG